MVRAISTALTLALTIAPKVTYAAAIRGRVMADEKGDYPVFPATISVLTICDRNKGRELKSSTNRNDGAFEMKFESDGGAVCVRIESAGYQGRDIQLELKGGHDVDLQIVTMNPSAVWVKYMVNKVKELKIEPDSKKQQEILIASLTALSEKGGIYAWGVGYGIRLSVPLDYKFPLDVDSDYVLKADSDYALEVGRVIAFLKANPELVDLTRKCEDKVCKRSITMYDAVMLDIDRRRGMNKVPYVPYEVYLPLKRFKMQ